MKTIGVCGTCRIENFNFSNINKINTELPYVYKNDTSQIYIRPLGYTTSSSDVCQNISLIKNNSYLNINNSFLFDNIFLKRGGKLIIIDLNYDYLIIEVCSIKKLIHKFTNLIIPYEVEGEFIESHYKVETETFEQTVQNILNIQSLLNCKIILLPPIIEISGYMQVGKHENINIKSLSTDTTRKKVLSYRMEIINRLESVAKKNSSIFFIDWNKFIRECGIQKMLKDQFHFTEYGVKFIDDKLTKFINDN